MTSQELTIAEGQDGFNDRQKAALVQLGVEGASDADLDIFFHQCQRTGLDPFARQIYMIGRMTWNPQTKQREMKQTIQTGIDGFRLIARRAADARHETFSMDDVLWADPNGVWHDLWIWDRPPLAAKVTVHVGGAHFSAVAATREYMPTTKEGQPTGQWRSMPAVMIAKCAEALALRKAFPMDLSGVYTADEMQQADARADVQVVDAQAVSAPQAAPAAQQQRAEAPITDEQAAAIGEWAEALDITQEQVMAACRYVVRRDIHTLVELTSREASAVIAYLRDRLEKRREAEQAAPDMDVIQGELIDDEGPEGGAAA